MTPQQIENGNAVSVGTPKPEPDVPLYDFQCQRCGHKFDRIQKYDDSNPACPKTRAGEDGADQHVCGGETKKLISRGSFHLKGGGWADTGYS